MTGDLASEDGLHDPNVLIHKYVEYDKDEI